jgi:hypothetical protein
MASSSTATHPKRRARHASPSFVYICVVLATCLGTQKSLVTAFAPPNSGVPSRPLSPLAARHRQDEHNNVDIPIASMARSFTTAAASSFMAASLLFSPPLVSPPDAQANVPPANAATTTSLSPTATSIDIDLKGVPALTRKAIINRDALSKYLVESLKSLKPILELLSESDTVTVTPPEDVKGAIKSLTGGDAQFLVNNNLVDVRVESVPGVIVVRVINPNIPRLPFLKDGSAALKFVDEIVDAAPQELEKAAEEVQAFENFLTWGAPPKESKPINKGSTLDNFLSSKFKLNGNTVSLGALGDLTNSEVVLGGVGTGVVGVYGASYAYYVSSKEASEQEAEEKKAKAAEKRKLDAKADAAAKKKEKTAVEKVNVEDKKVEDVKEDTTVVVADESKEEVSPPPNAVTLAEESREEASAPTRSSAAVHDEGTEEQPKPNGRKRDAFRKMFRRNE